MSSPSSARTAGHAPGPGPVAYRWVVFLILSAAYLLVYFHRQAPAVLAVDIMRSLEVNGAWLGLISAASFYPYALMQLPAGPLVRRWGARVLLAVSLGLAGAGSLLLALATGPLYALCGRALVGLGIGAVLVALLEMIAQWFSSSRFVNVVSWLLAMGGLGVFAGAAPLACLDHLLGWRGSFMVIAALSAVLAACVWWLTRDKPAQMGFPPVEQGFAPGAGSMETETGRGMGAVLSSPRFWPPAVWGFCALAVFISMGGLWGGPLLMHVYGLGKLEAGRVLSMMAVGMVIGSPLLAWLSGRRGSSRWLVLVVSSALLVMLCWVMALAPGRLPLAGLYLWFAGLGLATMAAAPLALTNARDNVPPRLSALATGVCNFFFLIGGAAAQPVVGWVLDAHGGSGDYTAAHFAWSFKLYGVLSLAALAAALLVGEPAKGRVRAKV